MARGILPTLAGVIGLRVMGVSLLLAGFVEHGHALGGTTFEAGLAFGAYPLALALFMFPLAAMSDRVGRRRVMLGALAVSALGGVLAALATNVWLLMLGRLVQGAGAVNGVALALAGEVGEPERRTRRMAVLGASAGLGFVAGLLLGAVLQPALGVPGLLVLHSALTLLMLWPVARVVPAGAPPRAAEHVDANVRSRAAWRLGVAALCVNFSLTGLLFLSPLLVPVAAPGAPYVLVLVLMVLPGGFGMFVAARLADRGMGRAVGAASAALLGLAPLAFLAPVGAVALVAAGIVFFVGHSSLSSLLPSMLAAEAPEGRKGAAQGIQSTLQYLGNFVGSAVVAAAYPSAPLLAVAFLASGALAAGLILWRRARATAGVGQTS